MKYQNAHTMIFAVTPYAQTSSFDSRKAKAYGLAQCRSIDMGDPVLVTDSPIRKVETLTGNISVRVRGIVGR